jgi:two-component system cell cycle response regulator DivK
MKSKVILIIEDNEKNLRLIHDILESQGYRVLQARSGKEGIEAAREQRPDLIIMDIQMPGIDGITATRILKQDEQTCNIPVIALTAMAMKGDRDRILQAGCDGYLPKPVRFDALLEAVENGFKPDQD